MSCIVDDIPPGESASLNHLAFQGIPFLSTTFTSRCLHELFLEFPHKQSKMVPEANNNIGICLVETP